jgi:fructose/tagatose bisphosphate aldolase
LQAKIAFPVQFLFKKNAPPKIFKKKLLLPECQRVRKSKKNFTQSQENFMMSWQHGNLHGKYDFDLEVDTTPFDLNTAKSLNIK